MTDTKMSDNISPKLLEVAERAKQPDARFYALAYLIDENALRRAFKRLRNNAAVGVDGITKQEYGENLADNLRDLHGRMKAGKYRHQPLKRVHIPKGNGKTRPIGISATEDKIVQNALREVLEIVYEPIFYDCSYGFRPGRSAHDAVRFLNNEAGKGKISWVLEADIESFFDSIDRQMLQEMLQERVPDGSIKRLVGKCLKVGVLENTELSWEETGTTQGSSLSPLLGNIYLNTVLDEWFETSVKPRLEGAASLVRFADDFIMTFERRTDAERVLAVLSQRLSKFGLKLHPEKTRLAPFSRPNPKDEVKKGPGTFDFLGFTFYWKRSRKGRWILGTKTRRKSINAFMQDIREWCRRHRHSPVKVQHRMLKSKLNGHYNYFGVNGNHKCLQSVNYHTACVWGKWLRRRSHKARKLTWEKFFGTFLKCYPLPHTGLRVRIW